MALSQAATDLLNELAAAPGTFIEQQQIAGATLDELVAAHLAGAFGPNLQFAYMTFFRPQGPDRMHWPIGLTYDGRVQAGLPVPSTKDGGLELLGP